MKLAVGLVLAAAAVAAVSAGDPATLSTTSKATKSTKTGTASGSGIGSLFKVGSTGTIGDESGETHKKFITTIGVTVPMGEAGSKLGLGVGPAVVPSSSGSRDGDESGETHKKFITTIGVTDPMGEAGSKLGLGVGPAVVPSGSGSRDWNWYSVEGSGSGDYDCDTVCPTDFEPVCGSDNVTYTNECAFVVAQCNTTELVVANSGECNLGSASASSSTEASAADSCPDACTMEYSPVTDENGVVYSNKCMMMIAKCKGDTGEKKKTVDFSDLLDKDTSDHTLVKETKAPVGAATKTTKATKSEKTGTASSSGIGSLFEDGSTGLIGEESADGSADPTLVKGVKEAEVPVEAATKTTKSEKTGTASSSGIGSLFLIGKESAADPTLVKGATEEQQTVPVLQTTKLMA